MDQCHPSSNGKQGKCCWSCVCSTCTQLDWMIYHFNWKQLIIRTANNLLYPFSLFLVNSQNARVPTWLSRGWAPVRGPWLGWLLAHDDDDDGCSPVPILTQPPMTNYIARYPHKHPCTLTLDQQRESPGSRAIPIAPTIDGQANNQFSMESKRCVQLVHVCTGIQFSQNVRHPVHHSTSSVECVCPTWNASFSIANEESLSLFNYCYANSRQGNSILASLLRTNHNIATHPNENSYWWSFLENCVQDVWFLKQIILKMRNQVDLVPSHTVKKDSLWAIEFHCKPGLLCVRACTATATASRATLRTRYSTCSSNACAPPILALFTLAF